MNFAAAALLGLLSLARTSPAQGLSSDSADVITVTAKADIRGGLSLEQAQREAEDHSPRYRKARFMDEEAHWHKVDAFAGFLPSLSLEGTHFADVKFQELTFSLGPSSPPVTFPEVYPYSTLGLQSRWTIFDGFAGMNRLGSASRLQEAADLKTSWALTQLHQDLRLKFSQAIAAQKLSALAQENVNTLEEHRKEVQDLLDNGQGTEYDVLRVEVQLKDAQTEKLAADDQAILARRKLAQTMGLNEDLRPLDGDLPVPDPALVPDSLTQDLSKKPDIQASQLEAEAAASRQDAATGHWLPKVTLIGEYQYYNNSSTDVTDQGDYQTAYQAGAAASWDLFNGSGSLAHQKVAEKQADQAREDLQSARQQASFDFDLWKRRYRYSCELYQARLSNVDKSKESVRLAKLGQRAGTRTTTEVLDAELDLFRATEGAVSAQLDAVEAQINLELALGKGI